MDFNARSAWVYRDSIPDTAKARRYGIWYVYVDPLSNNAAAAIADIRSAGLHPGLYFVPSWFPGCDPLWFADWCSRQLNALLPRAGAAEAPPAMLDLEVGPYVQWARDCIARYRAHQPNRPTSYTNAPLQGGYVPYDTLRQYGMPFYVQLYYGPSDRGPDMTPCDVARAVLEAARGYGDASQVHPFYDGARWTDDEWDGCQFTLERMP